MPIPPDPSDAFFAAGEVVDFELEVKPEEMTKLRQNPRAYADGTLREKGGAALPGIAVKLKGAAGSFRQVDDRPAFTINVSKTAKGRDWRGLTKFHLNNSVQDGSYCCEYIASELMAAAGIPAARVGHARVVFNGRNLGQYVLKEGFDKRFLKRHFERAEGNLYDGGFVQDIVANLERDEGEGPDDKADLRALAAACRERDPDLKLKLLEERLDIERFLTVTAMELMLGHWDGYVWNRNNYRIYIPPGGKAVFMPHGMDQLFQDPNFSILAYPGAMVASTLMQMPAMRKRYRERIHDLLPLFEPARIHPMIDDIARRVGMKHFVGDMKRRVTARYESLQRQDRQEDPKPLEFEDSITLEGWWPEGPGHLVEFSQPEADRRPSYSISTLTEEPVVASWRKKVLLRRGVYFLEANVKTADVVPLREPGGAGAGVRLSGGIRRGYLTATTDWTPLSNRFIVGEEMREVVLVLELRASAGTVWFERDSVRLRKAPR